MENKLSLYEITETMKQMEQALESAIDQETGEVIDTELVEQYKAIQGEYKDKINAVLYVNQKLDDMITLATKEIERISKIKDIYTKRKEQLTGLLIRNTQDLLPKTKDDKCKKLEVGTHIISYSPSYSTVITNENKFCEKYKGTEYVTTKVVETSTPNKNAIKKAINEGKEIEGAMIETKYNLKIK